MNDILGIIFGFDTQNDLKDLVDHRVTGAVPFGARYRLIDFALSNLVNSGIRNIGILMKDKYRSLMEHVGSGKDWDLSRKRGGLYMLPPYAYSPKASPLVPGEYKGKVDALSGVEDFLSKSREEYIVLCDSDIAANIPIRDVVRFHAEGISDVTMVCKPKESSKEKKMYVRCGENRIVADLRFGDDGAGKCDDVSIGIYVLKRKTLLSLLYECAARNLRDFEREVLPLLLQTGIISAYTFRGYCEKVTDIRTYFRSNLDLLKPEVRKELFAKDNPVATRVYDEEPVYYGDAANVAKSLVADGAILEGTVENSVVFRDVYIAKGAKVRNSVLLNGTCVLDNVVLDNVVTDKNVTIRAGRYLCGYQYYPVVVSKESVV